MSVYVGPNNVVVMDPPSVVFVTVFHPGGGPDRNIKDRAEDVASLARELAPKRSGALAASIYVEQTRETNGRFGFGYAVVAGAGYAAPVHEGAAPHIIMKNPGYLKFAGTNAFFGQRIRTHVVNHPGNQAQPFLQDALVAMVR